MHSLKLSWVALSALSHFPWLVGHDGQVSPCTGLNSLLSALSMACLGELSGYPGYPSFHACKHGCGTTEKGLENAQGSSHALREEHCPLFCCSRWVFTRLCQVPQLLHLTCGCTHSTPMLSRCTGVPLLSPTASSWSTSSSITPTTHSQMTCGHC